LGLPDPIATVVIPTLQAGPPLAECLEALAGQTLRDFDAIVVDNSGHSLAAPLARAHGGFVRVIENARNNGFGGAVNQGIAASRGRYVAVLNDDAAAAPEWLAALVLAADSDPRVGLCASRVMLAGRGVVDSAGMCLYADGSSKQRGHLRAAGEFTAAGEVLCPSGSAALYRRAMLEEVGAFDDAFFLYCEDTDLGLRGRRAGWTCLYVPQARVEHRYSHSAGRASPLKAYYVERNRLALAWKNFPAGMLWRVPLAEAVRYFWHLAALFGGQGTGAQFRREGNSALLLPAYVIAAHCAVAVRLPQLWRQRRAIARSARISNAEYGRLLARHSLSAREVAFL
jgi:GT2 family glycosyltransferase